MYIHKIDPSRTGCAEAARIGTWSIVSGAKPAGHEAPGRAKWPVLALAFSLLIRLARQPLHAGFEGKGSAVGWRMGRKRQ